MKDKSKIWTDCAECAYKHLTTAYALLTSVPIWEDRDIRDFSGLPGHVFLARAQIAALEVMDGYSGNIDLVAGCLSAAENCWDVKAEHSVIRSRRLDLWGEGLPLVLASSHSRECLAIAHIHEAVRELPEIGSGDPQGGMLRNALEHQRNTIGVDALTELIAWVRKTYELGVKDGTATSDVPAAG
jgi:hypothetical protein